MKITYVLNGRMPTERAHGAQTAHMCASLARTGAVVELVVPRRYTAISETPYAYYGVPENFSVTRLFCLDVVRFGRVGLWLEMLSFALSVTVHVLRTRPDIVYSREEIPLFFLCFFRRRLFFEAHTGGQDIIVRRIARRIDGIVTISHGLADFYAEKGIPREKLLVAPDGVDIKSFSHPVSREKAREYLCVPQNGSLVFYIGSLQGWKGHTTFLEASRLLQHARFVVLGGAHEQIQELQKKFPEVLFLGERPYRELPIAQAAADILVVPNTARDPISSRFTSPLKVFAHMMSERPIIASDVPALREILSEEDAFFVPPDDALRLADGIVHVMIHKKESYTRAQHARRDAEKYSWDNRVAHIVAWVDSRISESRT